MMENNEHDLPDELIERLAEPSAVDHERLERTMQMARSQNLLGITRRQQRHQRLPWLFAAAAASIAFALGWTGGANSARSAQPLTHDTPAETRTAASSVREAGETYARALAAVPETDQQARAAATATFRTVADQVVRLGVDDMDLKVALRYALRASQTKAVSNGQPTAVWF